MDQLRDLWIDGKVYSVPYAVVAHVQFLSDLNSRLATITTLTTKATRDMLESLSTVPGFHWTPQAKQELLAAITEGRLLRAEAMQRYLLSEEELAEWQDRCERFGMAGLCVRKLQEVGR